MKNVSTPLSPILPSYFRTTYILILLLSCVNLSRANGKDPAPTGTDAVTAFTEISWSTVASQPYNVYEGQGKVVKGKLYTFGGFDSQKSCCTPTSRAYVYDPVANTWTPIASMPPMNGTSYGGVTHAGFATDGTDIYFAGGYTSNSSGTGQIFGTKEAWKYIVAENRYVRLPDLPVTISAGQLEYLNGKLHHIGGTNSSRTTDLDLHYVLDLNNLSAGWKTLASLPNARHHAGSAVYEGKIYFIGGQKGHDGSLVTQKDVHRYDPATNTWTKLADVLVPSGATGLSHISSSVIVIDNQIVVLGGESKHGSSTNLVSAYQPGSNKWVTLSPLPVNRFSGVAANLGNHIYYTGGSNSKTTYKGVPGIQKVVSFTLINADTEQPIQTLTSGATLDLSTLPTRNLNIRANTDPATVGSVVFSLSGAESKTMTESLAPYALFGDDTKGDYYAWTPKLGSYTLKATPYSASKGTGTEGTSLTVNFTVTESTQSQKVVSFTLINADTEQPIQTLTSGATLDLSTLPTRNLNIRANTDPATVGSVVFSLSGAESKTATESLAPYALFGDDTKGDYYAWTPKVGSYTLKATPYSASKGTGTEGTSLTVNFTITESTQTTTEATAIVVSPIADAFVRNGSFANTNYGKETVLDIKGSTSDGVTRHTYLKFPLSKAGDIVSARLRIYGRNTESSATINASVFGVDNDSWTETGITWNTAPAPLSSAAGSFGVGSQAGYYEVDVTAFAKAQFTKDKMMTLMIRDAANQSRLLTFNSRENVLYQPELIVTTSATVPASNAQLFVENLDKFPSNDEFVASRIQVPWSRDGVTYNADHDLLRLRLHNKGMSPLVISSLALSNHNNFKILTLNGTTYDPASMLPLTINPGSFADVQIRFITVLEETTRYKLLLNELTIVSNDDKLPFRSVYLNGAWQRQGEGSREPRAQEMITAFGFKTKTGFTATDPDKGANNKPKGDEVLTSYFVRVDPSRPVYLRQMGAYHGCCNQSETLRWYPKGSPSTLTGLVYHIAVDAQTLLPRRSSTSNAPSEGSFNPSGAFGFKVGGKDFTDTLLNPQRKIGIRVWKAIDARGQVIPNAYIIANDYLGTEFTNYDYNDNMYYVTNVRPELGPAAASMLAATPQAVEFGEQFLSGTSSFTLNLKSLGQVYPSGAQDPAITISAVVLAGANKSEFTASMPAKATLAAQESTTLSVQFKPGSEGLKTADLLIYYNNAASPLRVPLHGIAKATGTIVSVPYRIKSGSSTNVTVNGKTWVSDVPYAFDNLEPYANSSLKQISATDEDVLYLREQSSNGDKRPFRYEMPIENGEYWVRLHFAEIYWGVPGGNLNGGAGSRVMSIRLENELRLINLDVAAEVGAASAVVKNIPVRVSDGKLNINFSASTNRPMICAVEVYRFVAGTVTTTSMQVPLMEESTFAKPKVYPNPLHHKFTVELPGSYQGEVRMQLVDMAGRMYELGKTQLRSGGMVMEVDISRLNLSKGMYFLMIHSENNKTENIKLLIQ